jgi:hypothetical protein
VNAGGPGCSWLETEDKQWYTAIEARRENLETELCWNLKMSNTTKTGRRAKPLQRARQLKATGESDRLIVLRDGRADHMGKGVTVMRSRQGLPVRDNVEPGKKNTTGKPYWREYPWDESSLRV